MLNLIFFQSTMCSRIQQYIFGRKITELHNILQYRQSIFNYKYLVKNKSSMRIQTCVSRNVTFFSTQFSKCLNYQKYDIFKENVLISYRGFFPRIPLLL